MLTLRTSDEGPPDTRASTPSLESRDTPVRPVPNSHEALLKLAQGNDFIIGPYSTGEMAMWLSDANIVPSGRDSSHYRCSVVAQLSIATIYARGYARLAVPLNSFRLLVGRKISHQALNEFHTTA
jgi:hypothetical protein